MSAPIRPSSSSIVQESVEKGEVVHTRKKFFFGLRDSQCLVRARALHSLMPMCADRRIGSGIRRLSPVFTGMLVKNCAPTGEEGWAVTRDYEASIKIY
jgi:hypothetical protein